MNDSSIPSHAHISALVDGCLPDDERGAVVQGLVSSPEGLQTWHAYHVVGDVLRSAELAPTGDDHAFWTRLSQKLADEPGRPVLAPAATPLTTPARSANAPVWLWQLLAGVACSLLVAVVGLRVWTQSAPAGDAPLVAAAAPAAPLPAPLPVVPALTVVDSSNGAMLRDPQLDKLMTAHQQLGGHSALQLPAGFLRNATYEDAAR